MRKLTQRVLSFFVFSPSYTSKVPEQRLDESNVGHQMLKKMGELNSKGKKVCDLLASSCHTIRPFRNSFANPALYIYTVPLCKAS